MTQIEIIKVEIEGLYKLYRLSTSTEAKYRCEAYKELLDLIDSLQVEPVSKDLEKEIHNQAMKLHTAPTYEELRNFALHFVEWQKEQMLAKAVDGEVGYWNIRGLSVNMELPCKFEEGDKVKVIIIKED
jgi:hypothetical protein